MNIQGWFPLGLTGLISLQSKGLSRGFSSTTVQKHRCLAFFMVKLSHPFMTTRKTIALTLPTFVDNVPNKLFGQPNISNWVAYKQKCISCSSGGWEVQDQGISRFNIWWGPHPHKDRNTRELSEVFFYKDTNPILELITSQSFHLLTYHSGHEIFKIGIWKGGEA